MWRVNHFSPLCYAVLEEDEAKSNDEVNDPLCQIQSNKVIEKESCVALQKEIVKVIISLHAYSESTQHTRNALTP